MLIAKIKVSHGSLKLDNSVSIDKSSFINKWMLLLMCMWFTWPYVNYKLGVFPFLVFLAIWLVTTDIRWIFKKWTLDLILLIIWIVTYIPYILTGNFQYGVVGPTYVMISFLLFIIGMFINHYYMFYNNNPVILGKIASYSIIFYLITTIQTYIGLKQYPLAARGLATGSDPLQGVYHSLGIGGFGFIYSAVFINILILYFVVIKDIKLIFKYVGLSIYLLISFMLISASYATSLLLIFIGTVLVFTVKGKRSFIFSTVFALLFLLIFPKELIGNLLIYVAQLFESNQVISSKFFDLAQMFVGNSIGSQTSGRGLLYLASLESFLRNPLFGIYGPFGKEFNAVVGGHSGWLDLMAFYGLFGTLPLFVAIYLLFRKQLQYYANHPYYYILLTAQILFVIFGFINPIIYIYQIGFVMFVVAPSLPFLFNAFSIKRKSGEIR